MDAEITGKLTLSLQYNSAASMQKSAKGFTIFVDKNWEQVKPDKINFERDVHEKMCGILDSETSRIEFVGTGRELCLLHLLLASRRNLDRVLVSLCVCIAL